MLGGKRPREDIQRHYEQISTHRSKFAKFHTTQFVNRFAIRDVKEFSEEKLKEIFNELLDRAFDASYRDFQRAACMFNILIDGNGLSSPLSVTAKKYNEETAELILREIDKLDQSNKKTNLLGNEMQVIITTICPTQGTGGVPTNIQEIATAHFGRDMKMLIPVANRDRYCLFYSLEMARLCHDQAIISAHNRNRSSTKDLNLLRYNIFEKFTSDTEKQRDLAWNLMRQFDIPMNYREYGLEQLWNVQNFYDRAYPGLYRIVVIEDALDKPRVLFKGPMGRKFEVALLYSNKHFDALKSIHRYFKEHNFCADCEKFFSNHPIYHRNCIAKCYACSRLGYGACPPDPDFGIECHKCSKFFGNAECFIFHQKAACQYYHFCKRCHRSYIRHLGHTCGEFYCYRCHVFHSPKKSCYIQPIKKAPAKKTIMAAFDFETTQDTELHEGVREHFVNYVSLRWACDTCEGEGLDEETQCSVCRPKDIENQSAYVRHRTWSFYDHEKPLEEFVRWILSSFRFRVVSYSHFGGRFDSHFVLRCLYSMHIEPRVLMAGCKIYEISTKNVFFRDSWLILQTPLDSLKKTFNLDCIDKPFFPYLFNTRSNMHKELQQLPPASDYIPASMKREKFDKFSVWYEHNKNTPFFLKDALPEYGNNDTAILMKALLSMRKIVMEIAEGYDAMLESRTIAGMCMRIFKRLFLKEDQLAIVPEGGFEKVDAASDKAIKLLEWRAKTWNIEIQHAGNGREKKIGSRRVDGFVVDRNLVIEFLGCAYHGCQKCYGPDDLLPTGRLAQEEHKMTWARIDEIKSAGYEVQVEWECDVDRKLKQNPPMKAFFGDYLPKGVIHPYDAYFGGRVNAFSLHAEADDQHEIGVMDIISLYPSVNFFASYPVKVPTIIYPEETKVRWSSEKDIVYTGLYKVRIIPPRQCYLPVIPLRMKGKEPKLLFPLCIKCCDIYEKKSNIVENEFTCRHSDQERCFTSTISSIELRQAMNEGYIVTDVYRIWNFEETDNTMFKEYVRKFLKLKVQSSGFPSNVNTDQEKIAWAELYQREFGIQIDLENVTVNPGLRHISKLALNSLWGKFSQRNDLQKSEVFASAGDFMSCVLDPSREISQIIAVSDQMMRVTYREKSAFTTEHDSSNVVISLWTTAEARLRLYKYLQMAFKAGAKLLYCDTDSIIMKFLRGKCPIPEGSLLGEMSTEYSEYWIVEFVAAGPKQYALRMVHKSTGEERIVLKLRGVTLDKHNEGKITFEDFKKMIFSQYKEKNPKDPKVFEYTSIAPTKEARIFTKNLTKKYVPINTKGIITPNLDVYPFGY